MCKINKLLVDLKVSKIDFLLIFQRFSVLAIMCENIGVNFYLT